MHNIPKRALREMLALAIVRHVDNGERNIARLASVALHEAAESCEAELKRVAA